MRLIFSRDRAAQLDLLLRSLAVNTVADRTVVLWRGSDVRFRTGYDVVESEWPSVYMINDHAGFEGLVRWTLDHCRDERTLLLCDDDVLVRPWREWRYWPETLLCFSLRLGTNTVVQYPTGATQLWPGGFYPWLQERDNGDFGYPGSLDGHQFRTEDLRRMLAGRSFPNPTALECALVEGCLALAHERPMISVYSEQRLVGLPLNRVSEQSNVKHLDDPVYSAAALNERFLAGERIDLAALDFTGCDGAHWDGVELVWTPATQLAEVT